MKINKWIFIIPVVVIIGLVIFLSRVNHTDNVTVYEKHVREPVFAGTWYPGTAIQLDDMFDEFFGAAEKDDLGKVRALILPHAGVGYSGTVAAKGVAQLEQHYDTVIVIGPSHRYPLQGVSVSNFTHYMTPLGEIKVSEKARQLLEEPGINYVAEAHENEHSIEIELPFLQHQLGDFELVPILVGQTDVQTFSQLLKKYVDDKTLVVVSVDLSHYHTYQEAIMLDTSCINIIDDMELNQLTECEIDAPWAVSALMLLARDFGWENEVLMYKNSGDVTGKTDSVVGYASIAFYETNKLSKDQELLLQIARKTAEEYVKTGKKVIVNEDILSESLLEKKGCFVTLEKNHQLRGCIGHIIPQEPLYQCVIDNAVNAAVNDRRFKPVTEDELDYIEVEVSILTVPQQLEFNSEIDLLNKLRPNIDGVIIKDGFKQSTYLPQVWESFPDKENFLSSLCRKAGSDEDCWKKSNTQILTYQAKVFRENSST